MILTTMSCFVGLLTVIIGITGYSLNFEGVESNITILKIMAMFYILISIEFFVHHLTLSIEYYHTLVHIALAMTALAIGVMTLMNIRRYPFTFVGNRLKDITVYGTLIWLVDRNLNICFSDVTDLALILSSLIIAVLSAYMFISVRRLRTFFIVDEKILMATFFVIFLIGESTLCFSILPLIIATIVVMYVTYKIFETAKPFILR